MGVPFPANLNRFDPLKNYRFLIYFGTSTTPVAGVSKVSALKRASAVIDYIEGGNPVTRKGLGRTTYTEVTLERGITYDPDFETWANAAQVLNSGVPQQSLANLRKDVRIELLDETGNPRKRYFLYRAWVSEFQALPDLDASTGGIAIEQMKLVHEGWEHDLSLGDTAEV
jgi:phage tail-like protein